MEGEGDREMKERERSFCWFTSLDVHDNQVRERPKSETKSMLAAYMVGRESSTQSISYCLLRYVMQCWNSFEGWKQPQIQDACLLSS